jgi:ribosomal-protein-alanine N-acetyltransferase
MTYPALRTDSVPIRPATPADAGPLAALEAACFDTPWKAAPIAEEIANPEALVLIAEDDPPPLGYAAFRRLATEGERRRIAVAPAARRRGLAAALLAAGLARLAREGVELCHLEVDEANLPAIRLYEREGFHRVGRRRGYYPAGRDALLYARAIRPAEPTAPAGG